MAAAGSRFSNKGDALEYSADGPTQEGEGPAARWKEEREVEGTPRQERGTAFWLSGDTVLKSDRPKGL